MVSHVANGTAYTGSAATSHSIDMPNGLANNDVVTVGFCVNGNGTTVSAAGWTQEINEDLNGASLVAMRIVVADAGTFPSSVTFTFSASQSTNAGASAWRDADTTDPIDVIGTFAEVSVASSINAPGITTLQDDDMAVAMCAVNSSSQVWGTAPWTGDFQATGAQCFAQSHLAMPTAGATGNATFSLDSKDAGALVFSIKAAAVTDPVGSGAPLQANQTASGAGAVTNPTNASAAVTQENQTAAGTGFASLFPIVVSTAESSTNTGGTSHTVTLPASIQATDVVLITMDIGSTAATVNALTDWAELLDENVGNGLKIFHYTGSGVPSNPTFTTSASTRSAEIAWRIAQADKSITPQIGTTATGTSVNPNPPSVTPTGGVSKPFLFIAFFGDAGEEADDDTWCDSPPTNYGPTPPIQKACGTAGTNLGGMIAAAFRYLETGSAEDPGTFTQDVSRAWRAQTIIIAPLTTAGAGAVTQENQTAAGGGTVTVSSPSGAGAPTQANQTAAGAGYLQPSGSAAVTQANQVAAGAGTSTLTITGAGAPTQANQTAAGAGTVNAPVVTWAVVGGVEDDTARIRLQLPDLAAVSIKVSTSSDLSSPTVATGTEIGNDIWEFVPTSLAAATLYYYGFGTTPIGSFETFPSGSGASYFSVVAGSCWNWTNSNSYDRMLAHSPNLVLHLGDTPYIDNSASSQTNYLNDWGDMLAEPDIAALLETAPLAYTWSDHDYGINDSDGTAAYKSFAQAAYRAIFPSYTLPGPDDEIYHTFVVGRVRFIMLDCFSERDPEGSGSPSTRTMLGTSQLAWLLNLLETATEPLIVIDMEEPWIIDGENNGWDIYAGERETIANHLQQYTAGRTVIIHGDAHMLAWDDGTNSNYATTPVGDGPPVFCFAPIDNTNSEKGGPYSGGVWDTNEQQYGWIEFDDDGSTITTNWHGFSVTSSTTETERFDVELEFSSNLTGVGAATQANQTAAGAGTHTYTITGSAAASQANQTAAGAGTHTYTITGSGAPTQADQTASGSGTHTQTITGAGASTQADQTTAGAGSLTITGAGASTQADQTATGNGSVGSSPTGVGATTQADQTANGTGTVTFTGAGAATQADQVASGSGTRTYTITGTGTPTQADQTAAGVGIAGSSPTGIGATTQDNQVAAGTGTVTYTITGAGAATQADQTANGAGTHTYTITGSGIATQADQTASGAGLEYIVGSGAATQADQTALGSGTVTTTVTGVGAAVQQNQVAAGIGTITFGPSTGGHVELVIANAGISLTLDSAGLRLTLESASI